MERTIRVIISLFLTMLVLIPVIVCNVVDNSNVRLAVLVFAANLFVMLLSIVTKSRMIELAVAAVTYVKTFECFMNYYFHCSLMMHFRILLTI